MLVEYTLLFTMTSMCISFDSNNRFIALMLTQRLLVLKILGKYIIVAVHAYSQPKKKLLEQLGFILTKNKLLYIPEF